MEIDPKEITINHNILSPGADTAIKLNGNLKSFGI